MTDAREAEIGVGKIGIDENSAWTVVTYRHFDGGCRDNRVVSISRCFVKVGWNPNIWCGL